MVAIGTIDENSSVRGVNILSSKLGYDVDEIHVGVVGTKESLEYLKEVSQWIRRVLPDRLRIHIFDVDPVAAASSGASVDEEVPYWAPVRLLIVCCSKPNFPSVQATNYINRINSNNNKSCMVLTDFDLKRNLSDRCTFYDLLKVGGLSDLLPRRCFVAVKNNNKNDDTNNDDDDDDNDDDDDDFGAFGDDEDDEDEDSNSNNSVEVLDKRDELEINGKVLKKPVLERPIDPSNPEVRLYYPQRHGGGCKIITFQEQKEEALLTPFTATFEPEIRDVRIKSNNNNNNANNSTRSSIRSTDSNNNNNQTQKGGYIYEEVVFSTSTTEEEEGIKSLDHRPSFRPPARTLGSFVKRTMFQRRVSEKIFMVDDNEISWESNLARIDRKIYCVTTASLPWMTGTAVNPLLRVAYLKRQQGRPDGSVTLVVPWLESEEDRKKLYGEKHNFASSQEQETYVREWLKTSAQMPNEAHPETGIRIIWYPARYYESLGSIFPNGDICQLIPDEEADFCILEEPEHLNWFRGADGSIGLGSNNTETTSEAAAPTKIWTEKFVHVVGIIHTNYMAYAKEVPGGVVAAKLIGAMSTLMVRSYCDKVIKLSATLQVYAPEKEVVDNVHGVRSDFLLQGERRAEKAKNDADVPKEAAPELPGVDAEPVAYFIAKILWEKGLDRLLDLEYFFKEVTGNFFPIDIIGDGPHRVAIESAFGGEADSASTIRTVRSTYHEYDDYTPPDDGNSNTSIFSRKSLKDKQIDAARAEIRSMIPNFVVRNDQFDSNDSILTDDKIPGTFHGRQDHANFCSGGRYKMIINPSITEVLCTTTAESLAMGNFAIIPEHPSNTFFYQFPNCLTYSSNVEFVKQVVFALINEPQPLTDELRYIFSWDAATDRLIRSASITMKEKRRIAKARKTKQDQDIGKMYNFFGGHIRQAKHSGGNVLNTGKNFSKDVVGILLGRTPPSSGGGEENKEE